MNIFRKTDKPLTQEEITQWLRDLRGNPYVPGSGFDVTAVFRAKLGNDDTYYFAGVNTENSDHRLSTHGEEGCISAMTTALGKQAEFVEGWVMGAPSELKPGSDSPMADVKVTCCGKCRQQVAGFAAPEVKIHSVSLNGEMESTTVGEFLPGAFSFRQFAPELAAEQKTRHFIKPPSAEEAQNRLIRRGVELSQEDIFAWVKDIDPVDFASQTSKTVVVKLANGAYVAGSSVEDAAYVSINPLQSAMAIATGEFGKQEVLEVWTFSRGRGGKELPEDAHQPLNLASIQALAEFARNKEIPIHLFNGKGETKDIKLKNAVQYTPTFMEPSPVVGPERLIGR